MIPPSWQRLLAVLQLFGAWAALAGGFALLAWVANRLDGMPEVWLSRWGSVSDIPPVVVVDAGHGGHDGGAVANGLTEKEVALAIAKSLSEHLKAQGVRVKMTRERDVFLSLEERSGTANASNPAAFVSLHLNTSVAAPEVSGIETYFTRRKSLAARQVATASALPLIAQDDDGEKLARSIQQSACRAIKADSRGVKDKAYAVVSHTACPAVLVECGFMTNLAEAAQLKRASYRDQLAEGIAQGVIEFLKTRTLKLQRELASEPRNVAPGVDTVASDEP